MQLAEDFQDALRCLNVRIGVILDTENGETILRALLDEKTIARVVIFGAEYPVDVSAKMPGFRIALTIRGKADWARNMAYLVDNYRDYCAGKKSSRENFAINKW